MNIRRRNKEISDLESALNLCKESARSGYQIAKNNLDETTDSVRIIVQRLISCMDDYHQGGVHSPEIIDQLKNQFGKIFEELESLRVNSYADLEERKKHLNVFSITLFGRTMAGKSTFMEILTSGDGKSIGNGAQRKTRDIRYYSWNGLEITDVPGVAAFEGQEDEQLAYFAASKADLVVFIITDDAPQPTEAECYAQVRKLGKPIIGIINIKTSINDPDDVLLFLKNSRKLFDYNRVKEIVDQFNMFADSFIPGKHTYFHATHLLSKYLSNQPRFNDLGSKLLYESRFSKIEEAIINEVKSRGSFLRIKSFIDSAVDPMLNLINVLLNFGEQNSSSGRVLIEKSRQFKIWANDFRNDGYSKINTLLSKIIGQLRQEIYSFVEDHYSDRSAGESWEKHVKSIGIESKSKNLLESLSEECKIKLQEIARELQSELSLVTSYTIDKSIKMNGIFDSKRLWNWGTAITSSGLLVAAVILGSNPLGWAAAAVGVIGWLFSFLFVDREAKVRQARDKLSNKLHLNINRIEKTLNYQLTKWFRTELLEKQIYALENDMHAVITALFNLSDAQRTLAWTLNDRVKELNRKIMEEAFRHLGIKVGTIEIENVARIPGCAIMLLISRNSRFPDEEKKRVESLLSESVWFVVDTGNIKSMISQAIGKECDKTKVSIEYKIRIAHIPIQSFSSLGLVRVKLAQQLLGYHIIRGQ
ncbi:MAG TPA: 50S ribosome-binding GTPase [Candidatus Cloacimonadota bacterium]|nr:50S ribosome-binding GTPase [Candidatus Cloacimonadota bacterium]